MCPRLSVPMTQAVTKLKPEDVGAAIPILALVWTRETKHNKIRMQQVPTLCDVLVQYRISPAFVFFSLPSTAYWWNISFLPVFIPLHFVIALVIQHSARTV